MFLVVLFGAFPLLSRRKCLVDTEKCEDRFAEIERFGLGLGRKHHSLLSNSKGVYKMYIHNFISTYLCSWTRTTSGFSEPQSLLRRCKIQSLSFMLQPLRPSLLTTYNKHAYSNDSLLSATRSNLARDFTCGGCCLPGVCLLAPEFLFCCKFLSYSFSRQVGPVCPFDRSNPAFAALPHCLLIDPPQIRWTLTTSHRVSRGAIARIYQVHLAGIQRVRMGDEAARGNAATTTTTTATTEEEIIRSRLSTTSRRGLAKPQRPNRSRRALRLRLRLRRR